MGHIDLRVLAHATEDQDKVLKAVRSVIPTDLVGTVVLKRTSLTGHHGNPIALFEARVKEKNAVGPIVEKLSSGLGILDKELLNGEIDQHLEKGNLYLRLDKQSAFLGKIRLGLVDPIHLRIHFKKHGREEVIEVCRKFGLLP